MQPCTNQTIGPYWTQGPIALGPIVSRAELPYQYISKETYSTCDFPGVVWTPPPFHLDPLT